jgi:Skp family chaperone for outer membrane proteins
MLDWTQWFQGFAHLFTGWTIGALLIAAGAAAWFRVPVLGHYIGLAAVATGAALIWGAVQYDAAADNCKEAIVRAQLKTSEAKIKELERQIDAGTKTLAAAAERTAQLETQTEAANKKADDYEDKLNKAAQNGACALDDDLWNRLRN